MMDARLILETGVVSASFVVVVSHWYDLASSDFQLHSLGFLSCLMFLTLLHQLLPEISPNLKRKGELRRLYRDQADPGIWCSVLLPMSWLSAGFHAKSLPVVETCYILFTAAMVLVHYNPSNATQMAAALLLLWLRSHLIVIDIPSLMLCGVHCVMFYMLLTKARDMFPKSFTEGEVSIVLQLLTCTLLSMSLAVLKDGNDKVEDLLTCQKFAVIAFEGVVMATVIFILVSNFLPRNLTTLFYMSYLASTVVIVLPLLYTFFGLRAVSDMLRFIMKIPIRIQLLGWWALLAVICILIVYMEKKRKSCNPEQYQSSTIVRKLFHVVVVVVYVPGLLWDIEFLYTSTVISLGVLIILETMRLADIRPLGSFLDDGYQVFVDEQDQGNIILTPVYLLMGLSLPLWIVGAESLDGTDIRMYAGVLSLGIGDTMASVGGRIFGYYRLPGGVKTVEGTVTSILCQCLTLYALKWLGVTVMIYSGVQAVILTSLLEAFTKQIDNLVLPPVMFCLLSVLPFSY